MELKKNVTKIKTQTLKVRKNLFNSMQHGGRAVELKDGLAYLTKFNR